MSKKQILLINDIAGYGKVATAAMLPILSYFGHPTYNLPTALASNTLDYGKFNIMDTTSYIRGVFPVWKELGFTFDAIATGFIVSEEQAAIVSRYCLEQAATGTTIFVDPIMGDEGKLYNGVTPAAIKSMREMLSVAHLCYPNYTEACYLTDSTYNQQGVSREEAYHLLDLLRQIGAKSVLITSIPVDGKPSVVGYNHITNEYFQRAMRRFPYISLAQVTSFRLSLLAICSMKNLWLMQLKRQWMAFMNSFSAIRTMKTRTEVYLLNNI